MKTAILILSLLLIYQSYRLKMLEIDYKLIEANYNHVLTQLQVANEQVLEWNNNYMAKDFAKRNNLKQLK